MSNIYYRERKLSGTGRGEPLVYVTLDNVMKVLSSKYNGIGLNDKNIPLNNYGWNKEECYYNHEYFGEIFIPKNIHLTNGKKDYFIVIIDSEIELRYWPGFRVQTKNIDEKINHTEVSSQEMQAIDQSFGELISRLGLNKTFEEHHKRLKGIRVKQECFTDFLKAITDNSEVEIVSGKVFRAATSPLTFFKQNEKYLAGLNIDEPSTELYVWVLIHELEGLNVVSLLDWKTETEAINSAISLISKNEINSVLDSEDHDYTEQMLRKVNSILKDRGYILLNIYTDSDSYAIFLAKTSETEKIIKLAKECKLKLTV